MAVQGQVEPLDLLEQQVPQVDLDHVETQDQQDLEVSAELLEKQEDQVRLVLQVAVGPLVCQDQEETLDPQVPEVLLVAVAALDLPEPQDNLETLDQLDLEDLQVPQVQWAELGPQEQLALLVLLEPLVHEDLQETLGQLVDLVQLEPLG